jgi:ribosome-binding ATPase
MRITSSGSSMEAGIVGLPNVGKSTLFNALRAAPSGDSPAGSAAVATSYPFSTTEPNVGVVSIPDPRLEVITRFIPTRRILPASLRLVDIPGLVRGSSLGEGLGNQFLSHIRQVDAILQVVRCFTKVPGGEVVHHVEGSVDPIRDMEIMRAELILADLQVVENALPKAERSARGREMEAIARLEALRLLAPALGDGQPASSVPITDPEQAKAIRGLGLITAKPVLYVANVDEDDLEGTSQGAQRVQELARRQGSDVVFICARLEAELAELAGAEKQEMLASLGITEPALNRLARAAYRLLGLQSFYTAGPKEVRAWTIPIGATAPQAAGAIHSDFERGFIRAEIYSVWDLERYQSEKAIKDAGKMRTEGKSYIMQDGDVCHFLFNV